MTKLVTTNQEAFDVIIKGLRKQGKKSMGLDDKGNFVCKLRGEDNTKCAIGFVVPDNMYSPSLECFIFLEREFFSVYLININKDLLFCLQDIHDELPVKEWEGAFKAIARKFKLTVPPINDIINEVELCKKSDKQPAESSFSLAK